MLQLIRPIWKSIRGLQLPISLLLFYLKKKVWQTQTLRFLESGNNEVETSLSVQISPKHDAWLHARLHLEGF